MPSYKSPGVYVEEVLPLARPIAGVGTSTAGFIGVIKTNLLVPSGGTELKRVQAGNSEPDQETYVLSGDHCPVVTLPGTFEVRVGGERITSAVLENDETRVLVRFEKGRLEGGRPIEVDCWTEKFEVVVASGEVKPCTTFSDFTKLFGDFSRSETQRYLAHAVFGFFNNGGSRCYVVREESAMDVAKSLAKFEAIDEIAVVAAPGVHEALNQLAEHCSKMNDRFAILECGKNEDPAGTVTFPGSNSYAGFYLPWIRVFDPVTKLEKPSGDGLMAVPPSGHLAGIYARVDAQRGVHKAPANEVILGASELTYDITAPQQDELNPKGGNCIRKLNGNIRVWGARTVGSNNGEFTYISTRRYYNYLRESIEEGTQFVVFEPNSPSLWERIKRTVGDFLLNEWRNGALFGATPKEAFFVKCDADTNPSEVRERGEVITMIGVAIVKPAEFVIFRIQQQAGG